MAQAAPVITAISAIATAGAAVYSGFRQLDAGDDAREISEREAELARAETEEEARRLEKAQERQESLAKARAAASGVRSDTGSVALFLKELGDENTRQLDWLRRTGLRRAKLIEEGGEFARYQARSRAFSSFGQAFGALPKFAEAGSKAGWWK